MKKSQLGTISMFVATTLACALLAAAQTQRPEPPRQAYEGGAFETIQESRLVGVNIVRLINTAELDYKYAHDRYANWDELYRSSAIVAAQRRSAGATGVTLAPGPEVVPGWVLTVIVSQDGKSYQLSLRNLADKQCRFSLFSDQSGLIYQGNVIGCEPEN
jgi:hypothetical protein